MNFCFIDPCLNNILDIKFDFKLLYNGKTRS